MNKVKFKVYFIFFFLFVFNLSYGIQRDSILTAVNKKHSNRIYVFNRAIKVKLKNGLIYKGRYRIVNDSIILLKSEDGNVKINIRDVQYIRNNYLFFKLVMGLGLVSTFLEVASIKYYLLRYLALTVGLILSIFLLDFITHRKIKADSYRFKISNIRDVYPKVLNKKAASYFFTIILGTVIMVLSLFINAVLTNKFSVLFFVILGIGLMSFLYGTLNNAYNTFLIIKSMFKFDSKQYILGLFMSFISFFVSTIVVLIFLFLVSFPFTIFI